MLSISSIARATLATLLGSSITTPFGGFKQSGTGRDRSLHSIEGYTNLKTTWIQL
ncbi:MAG: aldehyde dehydrogenase family protein [Actinobacteria bacterium]|nr:aldehyde dehydrogenase family protein [Actinomycetota bacterium]